MKFFTTISSLLASWDDVASALWRRYPNPYSKHVLSEDVIDRYVKDGKLHSIKLITKTNKLPLWGRRFYSGPSYVCIIEESVVDPSTNTFTTYTRNISMGKFLSVTEKCIYAYRNSGETSVQKSVWLDSTMGYGISRAILEFALPRYKSNQNKANLGLQHIIDKTEPTLTRLVRDSKEKLSQGRKLAHEKVDATKDRLHITKEKITERAKEAQARAHNKVKVQASE